MEVKFYIKRWVMVCLFGGISVVLNLVMGNAYRTIYHQTRNRFGGFAMRDLNYQSSYGLSKLDSVVI